MLNCDFPVIFIHISLKWTFYNFLLFSFIKSNSLQFPVIFIHISLVHTYKKEMDARLQFPIIFTCVLLERKSWKLQFPIIFLYIYIYFTFILFTVFTLQLQFPVIFKYILPRICIINYTLQLSIIFIHILPLLKYSSANPCYNFLLFSSMFYLLLFEPSIQPITTFHYFHTCFTSLK